MSARQQSVPAANPARWGVVPYITAWSSEVTPPYGLVIRNGRLAYVDESPYDRDQAGVLWARMRISPGVGRPQFKNVHYLRQRLAMRKLLCQVCGTPCGKDAVWMLSAQEYQNAEGPWPAPVLTAHPPLCPNCVERSARMCPHLKGGHVVLRASRFAPAAVSGMLYEATPAGLKQLERATIEYGDPWAPWMRASQVHMRLEEYTVLAPGPLA
ncbi:hypothetical protein BTM25_20940 [Actinomadura rubteroloni]|uniref:Uncharacterized protein n=1 Tax=Actinomadura rubteroloni TaxID=1926885 RepID=A0A2P4URL6_9ACTN|nr:hypothetical protein [Actinomadura rubteroloni]POM27676.1 hypothetical protein BTM25_20940 [Actinomadura rubteroloni]